MTDCPGRRGWLKLGKGEGSAGRSLICLPWAGAGASCFWPLARQLASSIDIYAYQPPGRETRIREPQCPDLAALVDDFLLSTLELRERPYTLLGHSFGAMLAYEAAVCLGAGAESQPSCVLLSGCAGPALPSTQPDIGELPKAEFIAACAKYGGLHPDALANAELMQLVLPGLQGDFRMAERWRLERVGKPPRPINAPLFAVAGAADPFVPGEGLKAWQEAAANRFEARQFSGDHFYLARECPELARLVESLVLAQFP